MGRCEYFRIHCMLSNSYCARHKDLLNCSCNGDETKCDFFSDIRETTKLQKYSTDSGTELDTITMVQKAKEDGKTYKSGNIRYNSKIGFYDKNILSWEWEDDTYKLVNDIFECKWQEENTMTKSEAEEKFGIKIVGD